MVSVISNNSLDLRVLHDYVHNLVLARRQGVAVWQGVFETAWAAYVLAKHAPENKQEEILNLVKGELLGENRLTVITDPYGLASAYMITAFLHKVGAYRDAEEFMDLAEGFAETYLIGVDWQEKFHFYSTPDYIYAASLAFEAIPRLDLKSQTALIQAGAAFQQTGWEHSVYVLALAGAAYLRVTQFSVDACVQIAGFVRNFEVMAEEDNIALLWFLDLHWDQMRQKLLDAAELVAAIDHRRIELRTKVFRFYPNYVTEPNELKDELSSPSDQQLGHISDQRVVSTIELLMLDEIAEIHTVSTMVVTREEWERRDVIVTLFDSYRHRVDKALAQIGLTNNLELIYEHLRSDNPAAWSQAALACRQVIYALSRQLLQIPDKTYPHIKDRDRQPMSLAYDREKNRLQAYMHQIGIRRNNPLLVKQLEYLDDLMRELTNEASGSGKSSATTHDEACSVVLHTYLFLGELERLTGFQIVTQLSSPGQGT